MRDPVLPAHSFDPSDCEDQTIVVIARVQLTQPRVQVASLWYKSRNDFAVFVFDTTLDLM